MDTLQLMRLLAAGPCTHWIFKGVFPSDQLPKTKELQRPARLVVSTDPHNPSEHRLAIYQSEYNCIKFFDSSSQPANYPRFPKTVMAF